MQGDRPKRLRRACFHHHPEVHDRNDVGDVPDDREVVRDQQHAEREPSREIDEEIRDLRLRGRVERREWLVEDKDGWIGGERPGNCDPLSLSAAELVRVASGSRRGKADQIEQLVDACAAISVRCDVEDVKRVGKLRADPSPRVQRRVRVLEDHLEADQSARPGAPRERCHVTALEQHGSGAGPHEPDGSAGEARLAAPGLAHEPDDLAALDGEACARYRADALTAAALVDDLDISQLERRSISS
jgi:hypothetical protein